MYETVADITDQMLAAARSGNWDLLTELEMRCTRQVEVIKNRDNPQQTLPHDARERKVEIIKKILADDREIRALTEPWMTQLGVMMNSAGTERKLSKAYGVNQAG